MTRTRRAVPAFLAALVVLSFAAPAALAQPAKKDQKVEAPTPGKEDGDRPFFMHWIIMILILAAIAGVNCIPSKRGHQD